MDYQHGSHSAYDIKYHVILGNEIPLSGTARRSSNTGLGADTLDVPSRDISIEQRSCVYADIMSLDNGTGEDHPIYERAIIEIDTRKVSIYTETILGSAYVGDSDDQDNLRIQDKFESKT
jgi:hypothetical protein